MRSRETVTLCRAESGRIYSRPTTSSRQNLRVKSVYIAGYYGLFGRIEHQREVGNRQWNLPKMAGSASTHVISRRRVAGTKFRGEHWIVLEYSATTHSHFHYWRITCTGHYVDRRILGVECLRPHPVGNLEERKLQACGQWDENPTISPI